MKALWLSSQVQTLYHAHARTPPRVYHLSVCVSRVAREPLRWLPPTSCTSTTVVSCTVCQADAGAHPFCSGRVRPSQETRVLVAIFTSHTSRSILVGHSARCCWHTSPLIIWCLRMGSEMCGGGKPFCESRYSFRHVDSSETSVSNARTVTPPIECPPASNSVLAPAEKLFIHSPIFKQTATTAAQ